MNRSHLEHIVIALAIQAALLTLLGSWGAGAVAIALMLGREVAQHEYRLALTRGWEWGQRKPVAWHEGVWRGWSWDSALDVLLPTLACGLLGVIL